MLQRIVAARVVSSHKIELTWDDGHIKVVDFAPTIANGGVFAPLADPAFFSQFTVTQSGRVIVWPGDIDFCVDALREHKDAGRSGAALRAIRPAAGS
jgi:hypothetical protein